MSLEVKSLQADLCVVGGGIAGMNVAITGARLGLKTVIIQERPVFGGNASGEIRMWVCGTQDYQYRETGILEELILENFHYNPTKNYNIWDALLYNKVVSEENIIPLLNCTCFDAETDNNEIKSVTAYQMTTQTLYKVQAKYYADCSGDSILAPLTGAEFMYGREAQSEYGEIMRTHEDADNKTMGNSCLIQARKVAHKVPFKAPDWAEKVSVEKLKSKGLNLTKPIENFWYIELGGVGDVIANAENLNKRLIALCLGIWDTVKNSGEWDADYYELDFLGFLGAKRESRRMTGDYVLTANDVMEGKIFFDTVAYGGWPLDDHNPEGFDGDKSNYTIKVNKPYGIPLRSLYSKNIKNLYFAGRNISASHMAMSSARVMGTCGIIGQAVGVSAYIANKYSIKPRQTLDYIEEVQQTLLYLDCYLPEKERTVSIVMKNADVNIKGAEILFNGKDRNLYGETNHYLVENGQKITYTFDSPISISGVKVVFDSDLTRETFDMHDVERQHSMRCNQLDDSPMMSISKTLAKEYEITVTYADGNKEVIKKDIENKKRNVLLSINLDIIDISLTVNSNWGNTDKTNVFTFEVK